MDNEYLTFWTKAAGHTLRDKPKLLDVDEQGKLAQPCQLIALRAFGVAHILILIEDERVAWQ